MKEKIKEVEGLRKDCDETKAGTEENEIKLEEEKAETAKLESDLSAAILKKEGPERDMERLKSTSREESAKAEAELQS